MIGRYALKIVSLISAIDGSWNLLYIFPGLKPGDFVHTLGDAHVYSNHVEPLQEQLKRQPKPFPTLTFKRKVDSIDDFKMEDFSLNEYKPHGKIAMKMAVWNL